MAQVIQIWDDLHNERAGYFRAYWCDSPTATTGSPVVGYCSLGGTFRTIKATALDALRRYPSTEIYRNGKPITTKKRSVSCPICKRTWPSAAAMPAGHECRSLSAETPRVSVYDQNDEMCAQGIRAGTKPFPRR